MPQSTDRNLLFAILALQREFIDHDALVGVMNGWGEDPGKPLGAVLVQRGALGEGERTLLEMAVDEQVERLDTLQSTVLSLERQSSIAGAPEHEADGEVPPSLSQLASEIATAARAAGAARAGQATSAGPACIGRVTSAGDRFQVVRLHASGGLGQVYLARDRELNREVALKEIQAEYAHDDDLRARFVLEAEITGGLEHPGIVPVYSLGHYHDGRPYYAMRFIRGECFLDAILEFHADEARQQDPGLRSLGLRKLLGRFVDVCNAVAYAHSRGVIHRDLKPDNIMLGPYGETLLVDWGLAKPVGCDEPNEPLGGTNEPAGEANEPPDGTAQSLLEPALAGSREPTRLGTAVGTPAYMSPEQAVGLVDMLGPASDIYSLGATLYAVLTGRAAFAGSDVEAVRDAVKAGSFPAPRKVDPQVPPALEAICLKAMAHSPRNRYRSARQLADEVEAWLADEPVGAWREPLRVRLGRWMRRRRTLVTGVAASLLVALVCLSVGVVLLTAANRRVRDARGLAERRAEEARQNFKTALSAVDRYLTRVSQDPRLKEHGLEPLRRDLLEDARVFFEQFVRQEPDQAELRSERGWAYFRLADITAEIGSNRRAIELLKESLAVFEDLTRQYPDEIEYRVRLANSHTNLGNRYYAGGQLADAKSAYLAALEIEEDLARRQPEVLYHRAEVATTRHNLGNLYRNMGKPDEAEVVYKEALAIRRELTRSSPEEADHRCHLAGTQNNLGLLYHRGGRFEPAQEAWIEARTIQQGLVKKYPQVPRYQCELARTWNNLAALYGDMRDRSADAGTAYEEARNVRQRLAKKHPDVTEYRHELAGTRSNLGAWFYSRGRLEEAKAEFLEAEKLGKRLAGDHPDVPDYQNDLASTYNNLGNLYDAMRNAKEAETAYRESIRIRRRLLEKHPDVPDYQSDLAAAYNNLANLLTPGDRAGEAKKAFEEAIQICRQLVRNHPQAGQYADQLGKTCANLAHLLRLRGELEAAVDWYARAIDPLEASLARTPDQGTVRLVLGNAHCGRALALGQLGRHTEAIPDWDRALELDRGERREGLRLLRAESLVFAGEHAPAAAEIEAMTELARGLGPILYQLAALSATASATAAADESLQGAERDQRAGQYAAKSIALLQEAGEAGYFDDPASREQLSQDPRLEPLRRREGFQTFLERLASRDEG